MVEIEANVVEDGLEVHGKNPAGLAMRYTDDLYLQAEARRIRNCHMDLNKGAVLKPSARPQCSGSLHCLIQEGRSLSTKDLCIEGT